MVSIQLIFKNNMSFLSMFILLSMLEQQLPNTIHREKNRESLKLSEAHLCHRTQPSSWSVESPCPTSVSEGERDSGEHSTDPANAPDGRQTSVCVSRLTVTQTLSSHLKPVR